MSDNQPGLEYSLAVYHAQGIVTVQAQCTFAEALVIMKERAQVHGMTVEAVAEGVLERAIRFG
jgi:hypothetical protein